MKKVSVEFTGLFDMDGNKLPFVEFDYVSEAELQVLAKEMTGTAKDSPLDIEAMQVELNNHIKKNPDDWARRPMKSLSKHKRFVTLDGERFFELIATIMCGKFRLGITDMAGLPLNQVMESVGRIVSAFYEDSVEFQELVPHHYSFTGEPK